MNRPYEVVEGKKPTRPSKRSTYPWSEVVQGRMLLLKARKIQDVSSTAYSAARRLGVRFTLRSVEGGVEVHLARGGRRK